MRFLILVAIVLVTNQTFGQSLQSTDGANQKINAKSKTQWQNLSFKTSKVYGTGSDLIFSNPELKGMEKKKIVVAVIDSGVDIEHEDLQGSIWTNKDEIAGNGLDDDNNGYIDDVHGWNFLVDPEGNDVIYDNMEATRVLRLSKQLQESNAPYPEWLTQEMLTNAADIYNESSKESGGLSQFSMIYKMIDSTAKAATGKEDYTYDDVKQLDSKSEDIQKAKRIFSVFKTLGISNSDLEEMSLQANNYSKYWLNFDFDPKQGMPTSGSNYGNNHYGDEQAEHGTHVAGIIVATRDNNNDAQGVAFGSAEIMVLRAVPDGDERDLDVANAIRYAADNGANIINMSFGKGLSPDKELVYEALEYAASKNVLIIHAAGNDSENIDEAENYPNDEGLSEKAKNHFLCIGAIAPSKGKNLVASFSNYGKESVHLFAPGEDIYSTLPGNKYGFRSGTSMAAPVAAGVAALTWSYNSDLSASELRALLLRSSTNISDKKIVIPGSKDKASFSALCTSGGLINAYEAITQSLDSGL